ncbi:hypothetical protein J6R97_02510 [bacterium]|nr:hypothetical protein [bacterium]
MNINNNKIYCTPQNKISFKAITLNKKELLESKKLLNKYIKASDSELESLKNETFKFFEKHLHKEINLKTNKNHIKEDFAQELFLEFFILLDNIRKKILPIEDFIPQLNKIKPDKNTIKSGILEKSIYESISDTSLEKSNLLTEANLPIYYDSTKTNKGKKLNNKLSKLLDKSCLSIQEKDIIQDYKKGMKIKDIANNFNKSYGRIAYIKRTSFRKLQYNTGILPVEIDKIAYELKSRYKLEYPIQKVVDLFLSTEQLIALENDKLFENVSKNSRLLNVPEKEFVKAAIEQPNLFYQNPEILYNNVKNSSKLFKISEELFIKAALKHPQLFYQNSETLYQNINGTAQKFNINKDILIRAAIKSPGLFCQKTETLFKNIVNSSEIFNVSKDAFIKAGLKSPNLFIQKSETLYANVIKCVKLFNVNREDYIKIALRQPQLFYQKPETLYNNIKETANNFDISIEELIEAAIKHPALFYQKPETLYKNIDDAAKLLNIDKKDIINQGLKQPNLFSRNPQAIYKKSLLLNYIKQIQGIEDNKFNYSPQSSDVLMQKLLVYLIKKHFKIKRLNLNDLINMIKTSHTTIYKFELPKHELNDEFIRFTKKFFEDNQIESNVEFIIKKA